ncbi:DUF2460 domain-containing protein [Aurantimonas sp. MSK8Z-1]|uniref:DUF2460 domain-containing protein n=1 Tax=Mangrovibrevibacter kandeliae TaxID=2968473 RepID=UPI0021177CFF|nr:DUF2460 domain-containing protein [Aurantimonas sp. MSK8Z-1]MCW4113868.1 DUF2460 domain-containing protein [Aurantimonas sp. MSK8Z-1]
MPVAAFSEERFPLRLAFGTTGGPERRIDVVRLSTGYESRNQRHRHAVRRYDAGSGVKSLEDLAAVVDFFEARRGKLVGFRFRDPLDASSAGFGRAPGPFDQSLGSGDGTSTCWQLVKRYGLGEDGYIRPIAKPDAGSVRVAVDGEELAAGAFTVDGVTGAVTLAQPPAAGASVTAGFLFDVPVRFDLDWLAFSIAGFRSGEIPSIPLVEVRP